MKTVTYFNTPNLDIKTVLLFFHGSYPKKGVMHKDATLPIRLFPNAKFDIRCKLDIQTVEYFQKLYDKRINKFIDEDADIEVYTHSYDYIYAHYLLMSSFRPKMQRAVCDLQKLLYTQKSKIYIFYNDENTELFKTMYGYSKNYFNENKINIFKTNEYLNKIWKNIPIKTDWTNVSFLINENKVFNWGETIYKQYDFENELNFNICYLSDIILYDLPKIETLKPKPKYNKRGVFVGFFSDPRAKCINKHFNHTTDIDLTFMGKLSENLENWHNEFTGTFIENSTIPSILKSHDWSLYVGKGRQSLYLGATFYEPLLAGIPVFIWNGTDKKNQIFPTLNCYFTNETDLNELVKQTDLHALYIEQIKELYKV